MKKTVFVLGFCILSFLSKAQNVDFEKNVTFLQEKIRCCSVPFSASTKRKVDSIAVAINGDAKLFYSDKKAPLAFNILQLYKEDPKDYGFNISPDNKFIWFHISADKIRMIRFTNAFETKAAYITLTKIFLLAQQNDLIVNGCHYTSSPSKPSEGVYFIYRSEKETDMLRAEVLKIIRPTDIQKKGDSIIKIKSNGEGWLDKDTIPVGKWNFYAKDKHGQEYLFKTETYNSNSHNSKK
ncbi:hypothetical protein [Flavobacterium mesophilum]|uniref:hypothetical protein n=1 Tax=Flavobacterium mesophilum TaxID=3143495 RepID=UPI0031E29161